MFFLNFLYNQCSCPIERIVFNFFLNNNIQRNSNSKLTAANPLQMIF